MKTAGLFYGLTPLTQDFNHQSLHFHKQADNLSAYSPSAYKSAISQSMLMIQQAGGAAQFDAKGFFMLQPGARVGLIPGTGQAKFLRTFIYGY